MSSQLYSFINYFNNYENQCLSNKNTKVFTIHAMGVIFQGNASCIYMYFLYIHKF